MKAAGSERTVLGRGLEALIPGREKGDAGWGHYRVIALERIDSGPMQPREKFDQEGLAQLAESFKSQGVLQPVVVKKKGERFSLIAGERRLRAAALAKLEEIPAVIVGEKDEADMLEMALVENLQREDLNLLEVAEAFRRLIDEAGLTQNQLALKVGKSRAAVTNMLRLLSLPAKIKEMVREGKLTGGHARAILALDEESAQLRLAERILNENLSVRWAEESARRVKRKKLIPKRRIPALIEAENYLKQLLKTSVRISTGLKRGKIEIEFYGDEDLERVLELFKKIA
jgi:ParB family chromosome partitioning protein